MGFHSSPSYYVVIPQLSNEDFNQNTYACCMSLTSPVVYKLSRFSSFPFHMTCWSLTLIPQYCLE